LTEVIFQAPHLKDFLDQLPVGHLFSYQAVFRHLDRRLLHAGKKSSTDVLYKPVLCALLNSLNACPLVLELVLSTKNIYI